MPCWTVLLVSLALIAHDQFSHSVMNETLSKNELVMPPTEQQPKHVIGLCCSARVWLGYIWVSYNTGNFCLSFIWCSCHLFKYIQAH